MSETGRAWATQQAEAFGRSVRYDIDRADDPLDDDMAYESARLAGHFGRLAMGADATCPHDGQCACAILTRHEALDAIVQSRNEAKPR